MQPFIPQARGSERPSIASQTQKQHAHATVSSCALSIKNSLAEQNIAGIPKCVGACGGYPEGEFHAADVADTSGKCWSETSETVVSHERIHCHLHVFVVFPEVVGFFYIRSGIWFLALAPKV